MLKYSHHAEKRMVERQISKAEVEEVCNLPDVTYPDSKGNACYVRTIGDKRIRVVVSAEDEDFVITVIDQTS